MVREPLPQPLRFLGAGGVLAEGGAVGVERGEDELLGEDELDDLERVKLTIEKSEKKNPEQFCIIGK